MKTFFESNACTSRQFCHNCRARTEQGAKWRASLLLLYPDIKENEFACPFGVPWDAPPQPAPGRAPKEVVNKFVKAMYSGELAGKSATFVEALLTSPRVSKAIEAERLAICEKCDMRKVPTDGSPPYCGMCGCKVSSEGWRITNLAAYEENLPKWGCKHPHRMFVHRITGQTYGWPLDNQPKGTTP